MQNNNVKVTEKWKERLETQINPNHWEIQYKLSCKTIKDNYLIWLQYKNTWYKVDCNTTQNDRKNIAIPTKLSYESKWLCHQSI